MENNVTFKNSLEEYKPVYFHFLDNLINSDIGNNIENSTNFVKTYNLVSNDDIYIINKTTHEEDNNIKYDFIKLNNNNITTSFIYKLGSSIETNDIKNLKQLFKYCIYPIGNDSHRTSLLIFEKNNSLYLLSFNSGLGNNAHDAHPTNKELTVPYKGFKICEDITNGDAYIKAINLIFNIFNIDISYKLLKYIEKKEPIILSSPDKDIHANWNGRLATNIYCVKKIIDVLTSIKNYTEYSDLEKLVIFNAKEEDITLKYLTDNISSYYCYFSSDFNFEDPEYIEDGLGNKLLPKNFFDKEKKYDNKKRMNGFMGMTNACYMDTPTIPFKYYEYFFLIIDKIIKANNFTYINTLSELLESRELSEDIENKLNSLNQYNPDTLQINDNVLSKQIFHFSNKNIYIKSQESGSCTWFALYWTLIFYHVINNDLESYRSQIKNINNTCYKIIKKIFIPENFKKEYLVDINNFIAMKNENLEFNSRFFYFTDMINIILISVL